MLTSGRHYGGSSVGRTADEPAHKNSLRDCEQIATGRAAISVASATVGRDDLDVRQPDLDRELPVIRQERVGKEEVGV